HAALPIFHGQLEHLVASLGDGLLHPAVPPVTSEQMPNLRDIGHPEGIRPLVVDLVEQSLKVRHRSTQRKGGQPSEKRPPVQTPRCSGGAITGLKYRPINARAATSDPTTARPTAFARSPNGPGRASATAVDTPITAPSIAIRAVNTDVATALTSRTILSTMGTTPSTSIGLLYSTDWLSLRARIQAHPRIALTIAPL